MKPRQDATPPPAITFLTQDEVRWLFAVITGKRDRALFPLAYHHGLRALQSMGKSLSPPLLQNHACQFPGTRLLSDMPLVTGILADL